MKRHNPRQQPPRWMTPSIVCLAVAALPIACQPDYSLWASDAHRVAAESDRQLVTGELDTLTSRRMAVDVRGDLVQLQVDEDIRVTIDGRKAALRDLERRQFVEVTARERGTELVASAVAARSRM
jgi:hypothetical protein